MCLLVLQDWSRCYQVILFTVIFTTSLKLIYHQSTAHFGNIAGTIFHNQDFSGLGISREFSVEALQLSTQRSSLALLGKEAGLFSDLYTNGLCLSRRYQQLSTSAPHCTSSEQEAICVQKSECHFQAALMDCVSFHRHQDQGGSSAKCDLR